ncbi:class I SAM-dependent methyltransferase [Ferroplasma sp.]|uniref:class I SAM-dependent methyltransferase n=1 Tax=Ferroplasma sp. TaxID=2591003 RepID=UPI00307F53FF
MEEVDFGTYHHSTPEESAQARKEFKKIFSKAFEKSGIAPDSEINILDIGSGLGFLSYITANYFGNSKITGIDIFDNENLKGSSLEKARHNMEILKLSDRVKFLNVDILSSDNIDQEFDFSVSNLVLHNLGRKRFKAYENIYGLLKNGGFFLNGDIFINTSISNKFNSDIRKISNIFSVNCNIVMAKTDGLPNYRLVCLEKI